VFNEEKIHWESKVLTVFNRALVGLFFSEFLLLLKLSIVQITE